MSNHEVPFRNAKKDRNGYATILVKFGEFYVPVKGKPLPLIKEEAPELKEIKRVNLTRWNLKDIPEISELVGVLCGGGEGYTAMLYWNGNECVWKLWDDGTTELKKRGLVDELLQHGPKYLRARSISIANSARNKHQKIPYAEIGEALRYMITTTDLTDEQLGKLFING